jgi:hypothetical protein
LLFDQVVDFDDEAKTDFPGGLSRPVREWFASRRDKA